MDRHDIELLDVTADGRLRAAYISIHRGGSITAIRDVSLTLPFECVTMFPEGYREVDDLSDEERAWISAEADKDLGFEGVAI